MATTRASGYVVTAAVWNAVLSRLSDDGATFTGAVNGSTGAFSSTLAVTGASTLTGNVSMGGTLQLTAAGGTIRERARTTPLGEWIAVSHSAGNFYLVGDPGNWVVDAGDMVTNRYTLIGKTMLWTLRVASSTIINGSASPYADLRVTIPGGFTANAAGSTAAGYFNDGGTIRSALVEPVGGATYVSITRADGGNITASTNGTFIYFSIFIEIQ